MPARLAQQVRLWVYHAFLASIVVRSWSDRFDLAEFIMFCVIGFLPFLEVCPTCGRLSWWELSPHRKWPNALWIGPVCRQQPQRCKGTHPDNSER
jgi:hypothetical protein